jgi:hypothetical protein
VTRRAAYLVTALLALALAGCGSPAPVESPPPTTVPPATTIPEAAPTGTALLWPVTDLDAAQTLQTQVDGGAQPWTLDPEEVALNYASTTWGWTNPDAEVTTPGAVTLTGPRGTADLTLVQPVRAGTTGIWVVSAAHQKG